MTTKSVIEMDQSEILQAIADGTFKLIPEDTHPDYLKQIDALKPTSGTGKSNPPSSSD